jgi:hypothetical protein
MKGQIVYVDAFRKIIRRLIRLRLATLLFAALASFVFLSERAPQ